MKHCVKAEAVHDHTARRNANVRLNLKIMAQIDFSDRHVISNVFRIAVPMLVAQTFNLLYNIVDRIFIGRIPGIGTTALGAVGLCFPLIMIITAFTNLFGSGGSPLFSIELGKKETEEAHLLMCTSFTMILLTAVVLFTAGEIFARPVLRLIGAESPDTLRISVLYFRIYLLGTIFQMTTVGMNPFVNAQGFPGVGMRSVVIGAVTNTILDPVFIFGLKMGVEGAAIATVISQILSSVSVITFLCGKKAPLKLRVLSPRELFASGKRILDIVSLGISSFVFQATNSLVSVACNHMLLITGGQIYISVMTIISSVRQLLDMPVLAFADGASPLISYNYGAKSKELVEKTIRTVSVTGMIYTALVWGLISLFPAFFISIFSSDKELLAYAVPALHVYFFAFVFQSLQYCGQTVFKALGKRRQAIFFSLLRKVVIVLPLTLLLPRIPGLGTTGVFMAEPVSNVIGGTACFLTMRMILKKELAEMNEHAF